MTVMKINQPRRGRKLRNDIERCRTACWAWTVRSELNLDFSKIERMLDPNCFRPREDVGGFIQPQLWRKYALGEISPIGNGRSNLKKPSALELAEKLVPSAMAVYESILWDVLYSHRIGDEHAQEFLHRLQPEILLRLMVYRPEYSDPWTCLCTMSDQEMSDFARAQSVDVLAVLLIYIKLDFPKISRVQVAVLIRWWLTHSIANSRTFQKIKFLLIPILESFEPILGSLSRPSDLSIKKTAKEVFDDAYFAYFFHGLMLD